MKHTKEQIEKEVKKLLADTERNYFEHMPFKIEFIKDVKDLFLKKVIKNGWDVTVFVKEDQFPDKDEYSGIIIIFNDDTGEIESYRDMSCGRPVPLIAQKDSKGKYFLKLLK